MENKNECKCYMCKSELRRTDRFIIISIEEEDYICIRCLIKNELTILKVDNETIKELSKEADNIEDIKKSLIL